MVRNQETSEDETMPKPVFSSDPAFKALRAGDGDGFHKAIEGRQEIDFTGTDLRAVDFRKIDLTRLVLRGAYLRDADFRGCDLRHLDLEGASIQSARISGAYFPENMSPGEIRMSLRYGTRIRVCRG